MTDKGFDIRGRLEEGVNLLDLVRKGEVSEGQYEYKKFTNRRFMILTTLPEKGVDLKPENWTTKVFDRINELITRNGGPKIEVGFCEVQNPNQSERLSKQVLPQIRDALDQNPELERYLREISLQITLPDDPERSRVESNSNDGQEHSRSSRHGDMANSVRGRLEKYSNVIVEGVAGCGKSYLLEHLGESYEDRVRVVVFHPATSYEDFVSGLRPAKNTGFTGEAGVFVELCEVAAADPEHNYLLFIDEINRANTSRVFGDLMLVLEASKRADLSNVAKDQRAALLTERTPRTIALQTPVDREMGERSERFRYLQVPRNLHVLGTMNTTDRSVGTIDLALRRRFHWVTMHPLDGPGLRAALDAQGSDREHLDELIEWYVATNERLQTHVGPDARLGHSYFFGADRTAEDIATDLLNQLKEVVATFNIHEGKITAIVGSGAPVDDELWTIVLQGQGLGRRPEIERKPETTRQASPKEGDAEVSEGAYADAPSED